MLRQSERLISTDYNDEEEEKQNIQRRSPHSDIISALNVPTTSEPQARPKQNQWKIIILLLLFGFGATFIIIHVNNKMCNDSLLMLQTKVAELTDELNQLRNKLHPEAYSMGDFALESLGGRVISGLCSNTYQRKFPPVGDPSSLTNYNNPENVIQGQNLPLIPGHCWSFEGQKGQMLISLAMKTKISHVTLGHITKKQCPTGLINTAPRKFTVYGKMEFNGEEFRLGAFEYNDNGNSFQTFQTTEHTNKVFRFVKLEIESNYGNPTLTCLYNFRVHGCPRIVHC